MLTSRKCYYFLHKLSRIVPGHSFFYGLYALLNQQDMA